MQAGRLRHVIDIEARQESRDSVGGSQWRYVPFLEGVRARVLKLTGTERAERTEVQGEIDAQIEIRWRPALTEKMRVRHVWDRKTNSVDYYDVQAVVPMAVDRRRILLLCKLLSAQGNLTQGTLPNLRDPS